MNLESFSSFFLENDFPVLIHGRGEKAFCSVECRDKHIRGDDCRDKCGSEAMKDYSASPCSVGGPRALASGVVAA